MENDGPAVVKDHPVVSREDWLAARQAFLRREKEFTKLRDELSAQRRALPWERVSTQYVFDTPKGKQTLRELFEGRSQLVMYHAMFNPATASPDTTWTENAACQACSFWLDNITGIVEHVKHRDVTLIAVSRAPLAKILAYQKRMGWTFPWFSSGGSDFNFDYGVSFSEQDIAQKKTDYNYTRQLFPMTEAPGISVFYADPSGEVFHTYSTYSRGLDMLNLAYHYLDIVPKGRDEGDEGLGWVRRHDEYGTL